MVNIDIQELKSYYENHSTADTAKYYNISQYRLLNFMRKNDMQIHTVSENLHLSSLYRENGTAKKRRLFYDNLFQTIDKDKFEKCYKTHALSGVMEQFKLTKKECLKIIEYFGIQKITSEETKQAHYIDKYGSVENGEKARSEKISKSLRTSQKAKLFHDTHESPFCRPEVREKSKQTVIERYGVDNVRKAESVKKKIRETNRQRYGGIGFESVSLMGKFTDTMEERYGVQYACLLPQCSLKGNDSRPNKEFSELLERFNIDYEREFVLHSKRFDFRVGKNLIEINPSFTHTTSNLVRSVAKSKTYHKEKSEIALQGGFRCIHVWDWDNVQAIINLLLPKEKIYARDCCIKEITQKESYDFLCKYHIQGSVKSKVQIALTYQDEIVSVMTFGTPRYNKNYGWELLRYCSSKNIVGGAEKIFSHFLKQYNPTSIISYCDLSKFDGTTYAKLGFTLLGKHEPSKHWFNLKTGRHITDNLLRQRGFDQLFGKEYGTYGKGTSNEDLMLKHNFIEVYDCGQATYIWNRI